MTTQKMILETEVLYQKLGNVWYAFCEIEGELIFTALPKNINPLADQFEFHHIFENGRTNRKVSLKSKTSVESAA